MNRICIGFPDYKTFDAGSKAKKDAENIVVDFLSYDFFSLSCKFQDFHISHFHPFLELYNLLRFPKIKNSIVFVQQPFSIAALDFNFPILSKSNKTIVLSHDVDFLRWGKSNKTNGLIKKLNKASCVIAHNEKYEKALREAGLRTPIINLEVFDYLVDDNIEVLSNRKLSKTVSFVGNLNKSEFIQEWVNDKNRNFNIELIGKWIDKKPDCPNYVYKGVFTPEETPFKIEGSFGLVWDGSSTKSCIGALGQYLRYNCPHKISLYLASFMPVFVWSESAMADFVLSNNIGYAINSLDDINAILDDMTESQYQTLINNIKPIQYKITHGEYLRSAIKKAEALLI